MKKRVFLAPSLFVLFGIANISFAGYMTPAQKYFDDTRDSSRETPLQSPDLAPAEVLDSSSQQRSIGISLTILPSGDKEIDHHDTLEVFEELKKPAEPQIISEIVEDGGFSDELAQQLQNLNH